MQSQLDEIPGVGPKSRNKLLDTFKNMDTIKEAAFEELCKAVPKNTARAVYDHYHPKEEQP